MGGRFSHQTWKGLMHTYGGPTEVHGKIELLAAIKTYSSHVKMVRLKKKKPFGKKKKKKISRQAEKSPGRSFSIQNGA